MDKPALVSLTFDDGLRCQFEKAVPILDRYGFPGTFFLVANTDPVFKDGFAEYQGSSGARSYGTQMTSNFSRAWSSGVTKLAVIQLVIKSSASWQTPFLKRRNPRDS